MGKQNPYFIVIEGNDGSGKGTQVGKLVSDLKRNPSYFKLNNNRIILETREPTNNDIGQLIRKFLKDINQLNKKSLSLLFAADRYDHLERNIIPTLTKGGIVVSERYVYSSIAYQIAEEIDFNWICRINEKIVTPDLVIILDVDPEISISRIKSKGTVRSFEEMEYFEKRILLQNTIRQIYLEIAENKLNGMSRYDFFNTNIVKIDGNKSIQEINKEIKSIVKELFNGHYPLHSYKDLSLKSSKTKKLKLDDFF